MPRISEKLREVLGRNKDLGNILHTYYIYECHRDKQMIAKAKISALLNQYKRGGQFPEEGLLDLAGFDKTAKKYMRELIALKDEPDWNEIMEKLLQGLHHLLDREIVLAERMLRSERVKEHVMKELTKIHIYAPGDIIEVEGDSHGDGKLTIHYLSMQHSPEYDEKINSYQGKWEPWRDTEMIFELNFNKGLFIWKYLNVHESLRGKEMGSKLVKFAEGLGKELGFRRFTVEYPNRRFWKKMGYDVPKKCIIEEDDTGYAHEAYKQEF